MDRAAGLRKERAREAGTPRDGGSVRTVLLQPHPDVTAPAAAESSRKQEGSEGRERQCNIYKSAAGNSGQSDMEPTDHRN